MAKTVKDRHEYSRWQSPLGKGEIAFLSLRSGQAVAAVARDDSYLCAEWRHKPWLISQRRGEGCQP